MDSQGPLATGFAPSPISTSAFQTFRKPFRSPADAQARRGHTCYSSRVWHLRKRTESLKISAGPEPVEPILRSENSPFAKYATKNARSATDPNFIERSQVRLCSYTLRPLTRKAPDSMICDLDRMVCDCPTAPGY